MAALVINEEFLSQVELLQMLVKNNVAGLFGGNHLSKNNGSSCDFSDYRDYIPGDDITKIDWNAFARFEKLYLKLYLDERQLHTRIYIDVSSSMTFGKGKKDEQAIRLAAALAYISVCEMDKVSIYTIRGDRVEAVIENMLGRENYLNNIGKLNDVRFDGDCAISEAILPSTVGYGDGMSIIISDFLTDNNFETAIEHLTSKKRDILCIQVLSEEELHPTSRGKMHFFDSEDTQKYYRRNINKEIMRAYQEALDYITGRVADCCRSRGAEYMLVSADDSIGGVFYEKLMALGVVK
ncbi:MAG: DUF58 domain-containing protein [Clostridiales bacterium]|nr:DUF58 domain-containing protein [Clostridiales bacterium]